MVKRLLLGVGVGCIGAALYFTNFVNAKIKFKREGESNQSTKESISNENDGDNTTEEQDRDSNNPVEMESQTPRKEVDDDTHLPEDIDGDDIIEINLKHQNPGKMDKESISNEIDVLKRRLELLTETFPIDHPIHVFVSDRLKSLESELKQRQ